MGKKVVKSTTNESAPAIRQPIVKGVTPEFSLKIPFSNDDVPQFLRWMDAFERDSKKAVFLVK